MSTEPQVGDRVRVGLEGEYRGTCTHGHRIYLGPYGTAYVPIDTSIEVLPRPIKVGDRISTDQLRGLPRGSVAVNVCGGHVFVVCDHGYVDHAGTLIPGPGLPPYTVKYIPD